MGKKPQTVWGIDIGNAALKALRLQGDESDWAATKVLAETRIEYPKQLTQIDAEPHSLVREAVLQFLSDNEVKVGERVVVGISHVNTMARPLTPPPIDRKKMHIFADFEAKQQIPFSLDDVFWDWQLLTEPNSVVDDFVMDGDMLIQACKRNKVEEWLQPLRENKVRIHALQSDGIALLNALHFNCLQLGLEEEYDSENPPPANIVIDIGTSTTNFFASDGYRMRHQRNIPLGGAHFTKQLCKELKLTFAKGEHLKRNVRDCEDAKSVIQAMRPVFNDMLVEVQRTIGFMQNIHRKSTIGKVHIVGGGAEVPGLTQYLLKNLGHEEGNLKDLDSVKIVGDVSIAWKEQRKDFVVAYGLGLQGLDRSWISTNMNGRVRPKPFDWNQITRWIPWVNFYFPFR